MTPETARLVQVCLRPFTPREVQQRQQEVLDRVEALAADGAVDAEVVWWSPRVCPPDQEGSLGGGCPEVVCELTDLADREGFSLAPFIEEHPGPAPGEGESLVLPVIALVVRGESGIGGIYPLSVGGETYTVEDGLRTLEAGESGLNLPSSAAGR